MLESDYTDLLTDVAEVLEDTGTIDGEPNIIWMHREQSTYDKTYRSDLDKVFTPYPMKALIINSRPRGLLTSVGIDDTMVSKLFISPLQFKKAGISPNAADRVKIDGYIYAIGGESAALKPIMYGGRGVMHIVKLASLPLSEQPVETAEKEMPNQNVSDASRPESDANSTGVNDKLYTKYPAKVFSSQKGPFIVDSLHTGLKISYKGGAENELTIGANIYSLSAMVSALQTEITNIYGSAQIVVTETQDGFICMSSSVSGPSESFVISESSTLTSVLGLAPGEYKGSESVTQVD